jgi:hypothetical protein
VFHSSRISLSIHVERHSGNRRALFLLLAVPFVVDAGFRESVRDGTRAGERRAEWCDRRGARARRATRTREETDAMGSRVADD